MGWGGTSGRGRVGLGWAGMGLVWFDLVGFGWVGLGRVWFGWAGLLCLVWFGLLQFGLVWFNLVVLVLCWCCVGHVDRDASPDDPRKFHRLEKVFPSLHARRPPRTNKAVYAGRRRTFRLYRPPIGAHRAFGRAPLWGRRSAHAHAPLNCIDRLLSTEHLWNEIGWE